MFDWFFRFCSWVLCLGYSRTVKNANKQRAAKDEYIFIGGVADKDSRTGMTALLLTEHEYNQAVDRAYKNVEDMPRRGRKFVK